MESVVLFAKWRVISFLATHRGEVGNNAEKPKIWKSRNSRTTNTTSTTATTGCGHLHQDRTAPGTTLKLLLYVPFILSGTLQSTEMFTSEVG